MSSSMRWTDWEILKLKRRQFDVGAIHRRKLRISSTIVQIKVSLGNSIAALMAQRDAAIERTSLQT